MTTGSYTSLGNSGTTLAGLGTLGTTLYGASGSTLYSVNPTNGSLTSIGTSGITYLNFAEAAGGLWAVGTDDNLYSIDASTGVATLIGATGLAASTQNWNSLASGEGSLFYDLMDGFYSLNSSTGTATFIGCGGNLVFGACSGPQMGAMALGDGTLYGVEDVVSSIYTINTSTGQMTDTGVNPNVNGLAYLGLAPEISSTPPTGSVPEPATWAMMLIGFGAVGTALRFGRRARTMAA